jgi:hypothetical protein
MWRQQHVVGHSSFTNVENFHPDICINDPDVHKVTYKQPIQDITLINIHCQIFGGFNAKSNAWITQRK